MKRHSTDVISLVFGLIFLGIAAWWVVGQYVNIDVPNLGWIAAVALIVLGLLGVAASLRRGDRDQAAAEVSTDTAAPDPGAFWDSANATPVVADDEPQPASTDVDQPGDRHPPS